MNRSAFPSKTAPQHKGPPSKLLFNTWIERSLSFVGQQARGLLVKNPGDRTVEWMNFLCRKMPVTIFKYNFNNICFFTAANEKNNRLCMVQHGKGQREPIHLGGASPGPCDPSVRIRFQAFPCRVGKEGGRVTILPYAEENQIEDRIIVPESLKQPF